jgi:hypothetical protein
MYFILQITFRHEPLLLSRHSKCLAVNTETMDSAQTPSTANARTHTVHDLCPASYARSELSCKPASPWHEAADNRLCGSWGHSALEYWIDKLS